MSQLSLYVNEQGRCVTHYSGFSWLAGFALVVWALQRRAWGLAGFSLLYGVGFNVLLVQLEAGTQLALYLAQFLLFGFLANRVHRWVLERGAWQLTATESRPEESRHA